MRLSEAINTANICRASAFAVALAFATPAAAEDHAHVAAAMPGAEANSGNTIYLNPVDQDEEGCTFDLGEGTLHLPTGDLFEWPNSLNPKQAYQASCTEEPRAVASSTPNS